MTDKIGGFLFSATYHICRAKRTPQILDDFGLTTDDTPCRIKRVVVAQQKRKTQAYHRRAFPTTNTGRDNEDSRLRTTADNVRKCADTTNGNQVTWTWPWRSNHQANKQEYLPGMPRLYYNDITLTDSSFIHEKYRFRVLLRINNNYIIPRRIKTTLRQAGATRRTPIRYTTSWTMTSEHFQVNFNCFSYYFSKWVTLCDILFVICVVPFRLIKWISNPLWHILLKCLPWLSIWRAALWNELNFSSFKLILCIL